MPRRSSHAPQATEKARPCSASLEEMPAGRTGSKIRRRASGPLVVQESGGYFAAIDPAVTPELRRDGIAREVISRVQRLRKEAGLAVSDRIVLAVDGDAEIVESVRTYRDRIANEVLAREVVFGIDDAGAYQAAQTIDLDGPVLRVALTRVQ